MNQIHDLLVNFCRISIQRLNNGQKKLKASDIEHLTLFINGNVYTFSKTVCCSFLLRMTKYVWQSREEDTWYICSNHFLSLKDCLPKIFESSLIIYETHEPKLKIICGNYLYVLLWRLLHILTLVDCRYLSYWDQDLQKIDIA